MKKIALFLALLATAMCASAQVDTLDLGDRDPSYYYWDTNWWDHFYFNYSPAPHGDDPVYEHILFNPGAIGSGWCKPEVARYCYTHTPLRIIGVAAAVRIVEAYSPMLDTTLENRFPDYFCLYEVGENDTMIKMAQAQWWPQTPGRVIITSYTPDYDACEDVGGLYVCPWVKRFTPVYEAYFDKPVVVNDEFYVSGTNNNNYYVSTGPTSVIGIIARRPSWYITTCSFENFVRPNPEMFKARAHLIDDVNHFFLYPDTLWHEYYQQANTHDFINMFPIFDTNWDGMWEDIDSTCPTPGNLRLGGGDGRHSAVIEWDSTDGVRWQLAVLPEGRPAGTATVTHHTTNSATLHNLQRDIWYIARIRTRCDSLHVSPWSDSLRFQVNETAGSNCLAPEELQILDVYGQSATFTWENTGNGLWELAVAREGQPATVTQHTTTLATITDLDTAQWYVARIRSVCNIDDSIYYSVWSDSLRFYVDNDSDDPNNPDGINTIADRYTYLMPNPASETVTVASSFRIAEVELFSLDGRSLQRSKVDAISTTLNLDALAAGTYIVRIATNGGTAYKKLIVK